MPSYLQGERPSRKVYLDTKHQEQTVASTLKGKPERKLKYFLSNKPDYPASISIHDTQCEILIQYWCGWGDSNPHEQCSPPPQGGASTNSATSAKLFLRSALGAYLSTATQKTTKQSYSAVGISETVDDLLLSPNSGNPIVSST